MLRQKPVVLGLIVGLLAISAPIAKADAITSANATVTCNSYQLTVQALGLPVSYQYEFVATIVATPTSGSPITINLNYSFTATSTGFTYTWMGSFTPPLTGTYSFSGTASLYNGNGDLYNTIPITFSPSTLTCPVSECPGSANSTLINELGSAGPQNWGLLGLGGANAVINLNLATLNGNLGAPNYTNVMESKPSTINGEVIVGSSAKTSGLMGSHGTVVVDDSLLTDAVQAANTAAAYFAGLSPTPSVQSQFPSNGTISGSLTVTGTPGLNVVDLSSFTLNNGSSKLTLTGPAGTAFVLNIAGNFNLHTGNITVGGGVLPLDVLYNITNSKASVTTMVPTTAVGILLAPNNAINSMDSSSYTGEIIGGYNQTITLMSGTKVTNPCQQ